MEEADSIKMVATGATASAEETKSVTFASSRITGGNWANYSVDADSKVTFSSSNIGLLDAEEGDSTSFAQARSDHQGVTFSSTRNIGLFDKEEAGSDDGDRYTLISSADDEEEQAVTTATVATFFATFIVAMLVGLAVGFFCCMRMCMGGKMASVEGV